MTFSTVTFLRAVQSLKVCSPKVTAHLETPRDGIFLTLINYSLHCSELLKNLWAHVTCFEVGHLNCPLKWNVYLPQIPSIVTSNGYNLCLYKGLMYAHTNQEETPVHQLRLLQITTLQQCSNHSSFLPQTPRSSSCFIPQSAGIRFIHLERC